MRSYGDVADASRISSPFLVQNERLKIGCEKRLKEMRLETVFFIEGLIYRDNEGSALSELAEVHRYRGCSRPQDKVYALMGLATDADSYGVADYTKTSKEVYTEFAVAVIQNTPSLDIIKMPGLGLSTEGQDLALASWVPNWTVTNQLSAHLFGYSTEATLGMEAQFRVEGRFSLHARGFVFDTISHVVPIPQVDSRAETSWQWFLAGCRTGEYHGGISKVEALFRVLLSNTDTDMSTPFSLTAGRANFAIYLQDFLKELGNSVSGSEIMDSHPTEQFLRWLGEERNGRYDDEILDPFFGVNCTEDDWEGLFEIRVHSWKTRNSYLIGTSGRDLLETDRGWMGHAHPGARKGDLVCLVFGCPVPMILRKVGSYFVIVGASYVLGIMEAEAVLALTIKLGLLGERDSTAPQDLIDDCYRLREFEIR